MLLFDSGLSCCQASDRHTEGGATDVVQPDAVTELHRVGVTTMLTADTAGELGACSSPTLYGHLDQLTYTLLIKLLEGVYAEDLLVEVDRQEASDIISAVAEGHLRQVVRPEAEVLGVLSDLVCCECCSGDLDHCTYVEVDLYTLFGEELTGGLTDDLLLLVELIDDTDQRHHDLWAWIVALLLQLDSSRQDSSCLHDGDFRVGVP